MGYIRVLQANVARKSPATEGLLQLAIELKIDIILIQEPFIISSSNPQEVRSINHPSFVQTLPVFSPGLRPRVLAYISRFMRGVKVNRAALFASEDSMVLEVQQPNYPSFRIINLYNQAT